MNAHHTALTLALVGLSVTGGAAAQQRCQPAVSQTAIQSPTEAAVAATTFYRCLRDRQIEDSERQIARSIATSGEEPPAALRERLDNALRVHRNTDVRLNDPGLFQATGITQASRFTAAINTQMSGVEAGVTVSPVRFFSDYPSWLGGFNVYAAALSGNRFRAGLGYTHEFSFAQADLNQIVLAPSASAIEALRRKLDEVQRDFSDLCALTVFEFPAGTVLAEREQNKFRDARLACGLGPPDPERPINNVERAVSLLLAWHDALPVVRAALPAGDDWARRTDPGLTTRAVTALRAIEYPDPITGATDATVSEGLARFRATHAIHRVALNLDVDYFDRILGFTPATQPKCLNLPAGMTAPYDSSDPANGAAQWQLRGEYAWRRLRTRFTFGAGLVGLREASCAAATDRELRAGTFGYRFEPSFSWSFDLLTPWSLPERLRPENPYQAAAPRLTIGIEASAQFIIDSPRTVEFIDRVRVTPYLGVQVSENVGFRLGVPITGDVVTETPGSGLPARSDLQWRMPLFLTTVLKLK